LVRMKGLEPT